MLTYPGERLTMNHTRREVLGALLATAPAALAADSATASSATKALLIGAAGLGLTGVGLAFAPDRHGVVRSESG